MSIKNYRMCVMAISLSISLGAMENDAQKKGNNKSGAEKFWLIQYVTQDEKKGNLPKELARNIEYVASAEEIEKLRCLVREINLCKAPWKKRKRFVEKKHRWITDLVSQSRNQDGTWKDRPSQQKINEYYCNSCYEYNDGDIQRWQASTKKCQFSQDENNRMMTDIFFLDTQKKQGLTDVLMAATVGASPFPQLLKDYSAFHKAQKRDFKLYDPEQLELMNFSSAEFDRMNSVPAHILSHIPLCVNVQVAEDVLQQEHRREMAKGCLFMGGFFGCTGAMQGLFSGASYDETGKLCACGALAGAGLVGCTLLADETQYRLGWKKFRPVYSKKVLSGEKVETKKKSVSRLASDLKNNFKLPQWQNMAFDSQEHRKLQRSILLTE
jgi:hypothetical protein